MSPDRVSDTGMHPYPHCLEVTIRLLDAVGEEHWAAWLREDLRFWRESEDTRHHLSAYGGMGSINDVWLCQRNGHRVTDAQEPWVNELFQAFKGQCHTLARDPQASRGFVRDSDAVAASAETVLTGCRCLDCGYGEVSPHGIECTVANRMINTLVPAAREARALDVLVDAVLRIDVPGADAARRKITAAAKASGISIRDRQDMMRHCPKCHQDNTAVYRWRLRSRRVLFFSVDRFVPADGNLPMREPK